MSDWLSFRAAMISAVSAAMPPDVLAAASVAWEDGPREHARHRVLLSIVSTDSDDRDSALSTGGPQTLESMKKIVVQVTAESSYDSGDLDALWLIEQMRLGLRKVSVREALAAEEIVIQVFPRSTRKIGGNADGRALSVHMLEFTCCATFVLETTEDAGLIERAEATGTAADETEVDITIEIAVDDPNPEP